MFKRLNSICCGFEIIVKVDDDEFKDLLNDKGYDDDEEDDDY